MFRNIMLKKWSYYFLHHGWAAQVTSLQEVEIFHEIVTILMHVFQKRNDRNSKCRAKVISL